METNQRLAERMKTNFVDYGPENKLWNQYVKDHKLYIRSRSTRRTFTREELIRYRHRPEEFYARYIGGSLDQAWVWLFLNDIRDATAFTDVKTQYLMFEASLVSELYGLFSASTGAERLETDE